MHYWISIFVITVLKAKLGKRAPKHTVRSLVRPKARALISRDLCIVNDCFMRYWTPFTWKMYLGKRPYTKAFVFDTRKYGSSAERDSASTVIDDCCFTCGWWLWWLLDSRCHFRALKGLRSSWNGLEHIWKVFCYRVCISSGFFWNGTHTHE